MKDISGIDRGFCEVCGEGECPEFIAESGSVKCAYCDHIPVKHVKTNSNRPTGELNTDTSSSDVGKTSKSLISNLPTKFTAQETIFDKTNSNRPTGELNNDASSSDVGKTSTSIISTLLTKFTAQETISDKDDKNNKQIAANRQTSPIYVTEVPRSCGSWDGYLRDKLKNYPHKEETRKDAINALRSYTDLKPEVDTYVFNDGRAQKMICLKGTIPVRFKGSIYHIPICIWLLESHPYIPPLAYVRPTSTMVIKPGLHVDKSGRVYLPYLTDWKKANSDLLGLIEVLCVVFGNDPPVYRKT